MTQKSRKDPANKETNGNWSRRTILTAMGGSIAVTGLANSVEQSPDTELKYDKNKTFDHDISIINNASETHPITIKILSGDGSQSIVERQLNIDGLYSSPDVSVEDISYQTKLPVEGKDKKHDVVAEYAGDRDSTKMTLTSEGPADYQRVDINVGVNGGVSTTLVSK